MTEGCKCHGCGRQYKVDLMVPDPIWNKIGMPSSAGLLCGICIMSRVESLDEYGALIAK